MVSDLLWKFDQRGRYPAEIFSECCKYWDWSCMTNLQVYKWADPFVYKQANPKVYKWAVNKRVKPSVEKWADQSAYMMANPFMNYWPES
jgi:hypothetical protein